MAAEHGFAEVAALAAGMGAGFQLAVAAVNYARAAMEKRKSEKDAEHRPHTPLPPSLNEAALANMKLQLTADGLVQGQRDMMESLKELRDLAREVQSAHGTVTEAVAELHAGCEEVLKALQKGKR